MYYRGLNIQKHLLSPVSQILFQEPAEHWRSHLRMEPTFAAGSYSISMDLSGHHICLPKKSAAVGYIAQKPGRQDFLEVGVRVKK